jgi:hypothetical protein
LRQTGHRRARVLRQQRQQFFVNVVYLINPFVDMTANTPNIAGNPL